MGEVSPIVKMPSTSPIADKTFEPAPHLYDSVKRSMSQSGIKDDIVRSTH